MKIIRNTKVSNQKDDKAPEWADNKHFHKIAIRLYEGVITIDKKLWYITGHGPEQIDEIYATSNRAIFKTHDPEKLNNPGLEEDMIKAIMKHNEGENISRLQEIENLKNRIKDNVNDNKILSKFLRKSKLERIVNGDN